MVVEDASRLAPTFEQANLEREESDPQGMKISRLATRSRACG